MAVTIYRSKVAITKVEQRPAVYDKIQSLIEHLDALDINLRRIQHMPDNFIEVELNNPLPANQVDHLGLQGPV